MEKIEGNSSQMDATAPSTELKKFLQPLFSPEGRLPGSVTSVCIGGGWDVVVWEPLLATPGSVPHGHLQPAWNHGHGLKAKE